MNSVNPPFSRTPHSVQQKTLSHWLKLSSLSVLVLGLTVVGALLLDNRNIASDSEISEEVDAEVLSAMTMTNCTCTNNLIQNFSFENGTTYWSSWGGNLSTGTYAAVCGSKAGHMQITSSWGGMYQTITGLTVGSTLDLATYAGTHDPSGYYVAFGVEFYTSSDTYISQVVVEVNSQLPTMTYYQLSAVVPANTGYARIVGKGNGNWIKLDAVCVESICNSTITGMFFNDMNGSNDVTITNNGSYAIGQFTSDYNLEATVTGSPGSVKFIVTGAQNASNTENYTPYNHPATGTEWNPVLGTYNVNVKVYSGPNGTGVLCAQQTFIFTLVPDCDNVTNGGTIAESQSGCIAPGGTFNPAAFTSIAPASGGTGTLEYIWIKSTSNCPPESFNGNEWTTIPGATVATYDAGPISETTCYRRCARRAGCTEYDGESNILTVTVNSVTPGTVGSDQTICAGGDPVAFTVIVAATGSGTLTYQWKSSTGGCSGTFANIDGATGPTYNPPGGLNTTTYYKRIVTSTLNGGACSATSNCITVTVNSVTPGTIGSDQAICTGGDPVAFTVIVAATGSGTLTYQWKSSTGGCSGTFANIDGATGPTYNPPGGLNATTYYKRIVTSTLNGVACTATSNCITVTVSPSLVLNCVGSNPQCNGGSNGSINASVSGGTPGYSYAWSNGQTTEDISGLTAGTYTLTVTDAIGCTNTCSVTLTAPPALSCSIIGTNPSCFGGSNGAADATVSGGTVPYTYLWSNGAVTQDLTGIIAGTYTLTVTDAHGCTSTCDVTLTAPPALSCSIIGTNPSCFGGSNGAADATVSGGTVPYTYLWSNGAVTQDLTGIVAGTYTLTVTDAHGCTSTCDVTLTAPPALSCSIIGTNPSCFGGNGAADATVSGGTVPYTYLWSNGAVTQDLTGIAAGTYTLTVTDAHGCTSTCDVTLTAPPNASLGDYVWNDLDADGIQDAGEPGADDVKVYLKNEVGVILDSTLTDAQGYYSFEGLCAGVYSVQFVLPAGYEYSPLDAGGNDANDSDANVGMNGMTATTTLTSGEDDPTLDAGIYQPASLGDYVWEDDDNDGVQDDGESGVGGVKVYLKNGSGVIIDSTLTDVNGAYGFDGLDPGTYSVQFVLPSGYEYSPLDAGGNDANDSDANVGMNGMTATTTLTSGEDDPTLDAGIYQPASLGDYVWEDLDADGTQDDGESGVGGVKVYLKNGSGVIIDSTLTDVNGAYGFDGLDPGTYSVQFVLPSGYAYSPLDAGGNDAEDSDANVGMNGMTATTTLTSGEDDPTLDAGIYQPASVGDYVWEDLDADGTQDDGESGVGGVKVYLKNGSGVIIDSTLTDGNGAYGFDGLDPGTYSVQFVLPSGYEYSPLDAGGNDAEDSDANVGMNGMTATTTLTSGEDDPTLDAGIYQPASLGDYVWEDLDADGTQDDGESGVGGVKVYLKNGSGVIIDSTLTDVNGAYGFDGLDPGTYSVQFVLPSGYEYSPLDAGGNDANDSDANVGMNGMTATTTLTSGEDDPTLDAGIYQPVSLGDYVWEDDDNDGVQDDGESGVGGVKVYLKNGSGVIIDSTWTDGNGAYGFDGLDPGTYSVQFVLPSGYEYSPLDAGGNDANDSDANVGMNGMTATTTLTSGEDDPTLDAGIYQPASLGDYVWEDLDNDGIQDEEETGVEGVKVYLKNGEGEIIDSTLTDVNGAYGFDGLDPGIYSVQFVLPEGYEYSPLDAGGDDADDSDANVGMNGMTATTTLTSGEDDPTLDAGIFVPEAPGPASLGDYVWEDEDADGIQDEVGTGVEGVKVYLKNSIGAITDSTLTDENGAYGFEGLEAGTYSVRFVLPDGYVFSPFNSDALGVNGSMNSDADQNMNGMTNTVVLVPEEHNPNLDAGIYRPEVTINCPPQLTGICSVEEVLPFATYAAFISAGGLASSACGIDPSSFELISDVSDGNTCPEMITRTYLIADNCGTISTCSHSVVINDSEPPVINIEEEITVTCNERTCLSFDDIAVSNFSAPVVINTVVIDGVTINIVAKEKGNKIRNATLYNSDMGIGRDIDLGTPNQLFGGSGIDELDPDGYNTSNSRPLGNVMIVQTAGEPIPDDDIISDSLIFKFSEPVFVSGLSMVDFEVLEVSSGAGVFMYNSAGGLIEFVDMNAGIASDNSVEELSLNTMGVKKLIVYFGFTVPSTGAVANLCFTRIPTEVEIDEPCEYTLTFEDEYEVGDDCQAQVIRTYSAEDVCGNISENPAIQTITVEGDYPQPEIICPADITIGCTDQIPPANPADVVATDNCSIQGDIVIEWVEDISEGMGCAQVVRRIYKATDACGNTGLCVQFITRSGIPEQIIFQGQVFLQAPINMDTLMDVTLNNMGLLPSDQPYDMTPYNYMGTEHCDAMDIDVVDWILVQLRNAETQEVVVQKAGLVKQNGTILSADCVSPISFDAQGGMYYLAICHRNHLGIITDVPMDCSEGWVTYDFTTNQGLNAGMVEVIDGVFAMTKGDVNGDNLIKYNGSNNDKNAILSAVGILTPNNVIEGYNRYDVNMDGVVKYNGSNNDKNAILSVVGVLTPNNVIVGPLYE